jgi:hypothetical protein
MKSIWKTIGWNTSLAAERARHNLRLKKNKKRNKPQASSFKQQAPSLKRHEKDTIK